MNWYAALYRKMHFDMHTPGDIEGVAADFDAEVLADRLARIGVQAICWFAKCAYGWSYYPTKVGRRHPHLHADIFPLTVEACHARGIRVIGYYHLTGCQWAIGEHPEWYARDAAGEVEAWQEIAVKYGLCPLGPAGEELMIPQLVEIVTLQPADGVFIDDLVGWRVCYCQACQRGFGKQVPRSPQDEGWDEYLEWRRQAAKEFFTRAAAAVHKARPEALFGINYAGSFRHPDFIPRGVDYLTADVDETESSSFNASLLLRQWARQTLPHDAMNSRMLHWWRDWTQKPVTAMKQEFATVLANGGRTFLGDISYHRTGMPDPAVLENAGEAFALAREIEPYVRETEPVADIAILNSARSHYLQSRSPNTDPPAVKGAHLALLEGGLYAHVLTEQDIPLLPEYRCLVVPEQANLARKTVAAIAAYVQSGGGLVVIGDTQLAKVLGIRRLGLFQGERQYFVCEEGDLNPADEVMCPPRLVHGLAVRAQVTTAQVLGWHIAPLAGSPPHSGPAPDRQSGYPAITINEWGKGRAAFVTLPVATDLWARGHAALAPLMAGLVRRVCTPLVELDSAAPVEVTLLRRQGALLVHLVNYSASRNPGRPPTVSAITTATGVRVRLRLDAEPMAVEGTPAKVRWRMENGVLLITVQRLEVWQCVEVRIPA